jgi:hypothetical protein
MGGTGSWLGAAQLLAGATYMNTDKNLGTTNSNWINGKYDYIENFAPGKTIYEGMDSLGTGGLTWVQNANPTASFLLSMLQKGEDVEIGLIPTSGIGHVMTLSSINWNDANNNMAFDAGDTLSIDGIDPVGGAAFNYNLSPGAAMTFNGGPYNGYTLVAALAESVPEPATFGLLLLGTGLLAVRRSRRQAA